MLLTLMFEELSVTVLLQQIDVGLVLIKVIETDNVRVAQL